MNVRGINGLAAIVLTTVTALGPSINHTLSGRYWPNHIIKEDMVLPPESLEQRQPMGREDYVKNIYPFIKQHAKKSEDQLREIRIANILYDTASLLSETFTHAPNIVVFTAIAYHESRFHEKAESEKGAVGVLQIKPSTALEVYEKLKDINFPGLPELKKLSTISMREEILNNPELGTILAGAYLTMLMERYEGNLYEALRAYNAGPRRKDIDAATHYANAVTQKINEITMMFNTQDSINIEGN